MVRYFSAVKHICGLTSDLFARIVIRINTAHIAREDAMSEAREADPEGTNAQLLANALTRAEKAEDDLRTEILHSAKMRDERDALAAELDQAIGRIEDLLAEAKELEAKNAALQEAAFRAEHRELVNAANWHKAAEDAKNGKWANLLCRLEGMTAEERRAKVILSMGKQREIRLSRARGE